MVKLTLRSSGKDMASIPQLSQSTSPTSKFPLKIFRNSEIEPGATESGSKYTNHRAMLSVFYPWLQTSSKQKQKEQKGDLNNGADLKMAPLINCSIS